MPYTRAARPGLTPSTRLSQPARRLHHELLARDTAGGAKHRAQAAEAPDRLTNMRSQTPARAVLLSAISTICLTAAVGGLIGSLINRPGTAGVAALVSGCAAGLGAFLTRRRSMARFSAVHQAAHERGFAEGMSHGLLLGVAQYEAAVFPAILDGVTAEERVARRTYAYQVAAQEALPETIRRLAAHVLAALDEEDRDLARDAMRELSLAVREQHSR